MHQNRKDIPCLISKSMKLFFCYTLIIIIDEHLNQIPPSLSIVNKCTNYLNMLENHINFIGLNVSVHLGGPNKRFFFKNTEGPP